mmetsp:Transcript_90035/g.240510  ORF Transcript_90035/g.240510 Transcript_90035/m.240510 type:complete len:115 (-) Transcript_90035:442-786(-)
MSSRGRLSGAGWDNSLSVNRSRVHWGTNMMQSCNLTCIPAGGHVIRNVMICDIIMLFAIWRLSHLENQCECDRTYHITFPYASSDRRALERELAKAAELTGNIDVICTGESMWK